MKSFAGMFASSFLIIFFVGAGVRVLIDILVLGDAFGDVRWLSIIIAHIAIAIGGALPIAYVAKKNSEKDKQH
ncbi:MAG: hypothetical protein FWF80_00855 [Defluviitaleaceae bacterium]|nr:hypothetical protein [Defluviitaleaceae bacterium]